MWYFVFVRLRVTARKLEATSLLPNFMKSSCTVDFNLYKKQKKRGTVEVMTEILYIIMTFFTCIREYLI